ncbi:transposase [Embleya sp. NPDC050493]|uniref:transposase n=1 Tax=Embleya sp. NPDC050493 TaxID=3363989 RepID=UPI0037A4FD99
MDDVPQAKHPGPATSIRRPRPAHAARTGRRSLPGLALRQRRRAPRGSGAAPCDIRSRCRTTPHGVFAGVGTAQFGGPERVEGRRGAAATSWDHVPPRATRCRWGSPHHRVELPSRLRDYPLTQRQIRLDQHPLGDGGYRGTGVLVPHRRERGQDELPDRKHDHNASHRRVRARVEHVFARMKTWKILRDCRLKGAGVHHAMLGIARLHNLTLAG